jgi:phage terminase large subunit-like protein
VLPRGVYFKSFDKIESVPVNCIQVAAPDGIYLAGDSSIPTHNSTLMTYGLNIQEILKNPEVRIGIFSHTRQLAKAFLHRIKHTFESNTVLKNIFADILWNNPSYEAPRWSLDEGIIIRRLGVYHEATVEANGLVDSMPTGKHYDILHYDDVVTRDSVTTPAQLEKVDECFKLSFNLGAVDHISGEKGKIRVIGTPYHFNDQYAKMEKEGGWVIRKRKCIDEAGEPVLLSQEILDEKRKQMGPYVFATQMLLDPREAGRNKFQFSWLRYYKELPDSLTLYLLVDPANEKKASKTGSDFTCYWLWGLDAFGNYFWVHGVREQLNLTERWTKLVQICRKFPKIIRIGYERYGMQADLQFFQHMSERDSIYLPFIQELGGSMKKEDRILRMVPMFEQGRVFLPETMWTEDGRDLVAEFINEEYMFFPFAPHDDMLDAASRIEDVELSAYRPFFPEAETSGDVIDFGWAKAKKASRFASC